MSNLNSLLIEGTVSGNAGVVKKRGKERCSFVISSLRCFRDGESIKEQETRIWVMIRDAGLVKTAAVKACNGRGLRVVGRLASGEDGSVYLEAEHVEYRPGPDAIVADEGD
jgi:hypothetical protein